MEIPTMSSHEISWRRRARCKNVDVDMFFPENGENVTFIRDFCRGCEVAPECLQYALDDHLADGVWGGTTPRERRDIIMGRKENPYAAVRR